MTPRPPGDASPDAVGLLAEALAARDELFVDDEYRRWATEMLAASPELASRLAAHPDNLVYWPGDQTASPFVIAPFLPVMDAEDALRDALRDVVLAAHYGGEAMDMKKRGGREKLAYIERLATAALRENRLSARGPGAGHPDGCWPPTCPLHRAGHTGDEHEQGAGPDPDVAPPDECRECRWQAPDHDSDCSLAAVRHQTGDGE